MTEREKLIIGAENNKFFADFMSYVKYLEKQPIKMTATGNISMSNIKVLLDSFLQRQPFDDFAKNGWKIRYEYEVEFLEQIKTIVEVMDINYKRKGEIRLSKNGKGYLNNIDSLIQYLNMVLFYWSRVAWDYFSSGREINRMTVTSILQKNQKMIWKFFLDNKLNWFDFDMFCKWIWKTFEFEKFYIDSYDTDFEYHLDIESCLFNKNLTRFGCMEIEEAKDKHGLEQIVRFRPTPLGLLMFTKAQETWV